MAELSSVLQNTCKTINWNILWKHVIRNVTKVTSGKHELCNLRREYRKSKAMTMKLVINIYFQ